MTPYDITGPFEAPPAGYGTIAGVEAVPTLATAGMPWREGFGEAYWAVQSTPASAAATGTLTAAGAFADGEQVTIGARTYTLKSPFVDAANNIDASGTIAQTCENLRRAINGDGVAGVNYGTGTAPHADVSATDTPTTVVATARVAGTAGNLIATTETGVNMSWAAATLTGGLGALVGGTVDVMPWWYNPIAACWCSAGPVTRLTIAAVDVSPPVGAGAIFRMMAPAGSSRIALQVVNVATDGTLSRSVAATRKAA